LVFIVVWLFGGFVLSLNWLFGDVFGFLVLIGSCFFYVFLLYSLLHCFNQRFIMLRQLKKN
jgi:uncharacterized membrane protein